MPDEISDMNFLEGVNAYQSARLKAFWDEIASLLRGKSAELMSFEDVRARLRLREEAYRGLQDVPLDQVVGSVGRYKEFTGKFLPKRSIAQDRWSRVYAHATGLTGLPPIELYKVGDLYFVRDGNHRVSVARQLGNDTIQAHVTELPTSIHLRPGMSEEELDAAAAYAEFLDQTRLDLTRPHHQALNLTEQSRYTDLLGHIHLHRALMRRENDDEVTFEEAASNWYDNVYRPAVTLIRKYNILENIPKRTEADLYLWMIEHLRDLRDQGAEEDEMGFGDALVNFLQSRGMDVPDDLIAEAQEDNSVDLVSAEMEVYEQVKTRRDRDARETTYADYPDWD